MKLQNCWSLKDRSSTLQPYFTSSPTSLLVTSKEIRIKNNMQEWFQREIAESIHDHKKLFLQLHIDKEIYKKVKIMSKILLVKRKENPVKLILDKKKPTELWKTLKSMGLPSVTASNICLKDKLETAFNTTKSSIFSFFFWHKIWYLSCLLHLIPLLNSKLHPTKAMSKDLNFQFKPTQVSWHW